MSQVKQGEVYQIGNHIVGCGSSLDKDFVSKVIGTKKIRAVVSDPPYGVAYVENKKGLADCLLYTSPSPRDLSTSRMPSSA